MKMQNESPVGLSTWALIVVAVVAFGGLVALVVANGGDVEAATVQILAIITAVSTVVMAVLRQWRAVRALAAGNDEQEAPEALPVVPQDEGDGDSAFDADGQPLIPELEDRG